MDREHLLQAAEALDAENADAAWRTLSGLRALSASAPERRLALSLWKRAVNLSMAKDRLSSADGLAILRFVADLDNIAATGNHWRLYDDLAAVDPAIDAGALASVLVTALGDVVSDMPRELRNELLIRCFMAGRADLLSDLWEHYFRTAPDFVPDFWLFQAFYRSLHEMTEGEAGDRILGMCRAAGRETLLPLLRVYLALLHQRELADAFAAARDLTDPMQRRMIVLWLRGNSHPRDMIAEAVRLHADLSGPDDHDERAYMQARLKAAEGAWAEVKAITSGLPADVEFQGEALCLEALAEGHLGHYDAAHAALRHVRAGRDVPWFLSGRAALVGAVVSRLAHGAPPPDLASPPTLSVVAGRPLAQSLWIGPRLRWIEEMSIRSYLRNGWRYQLFVYDIPENVPEGVEVMDATAILPRSTVFREGAGSGMHRGSLGAFSDLFRYALLSRRGGLWTDTDVINLDRFEPDGARMIATEWTDAGIIGPNGALMAAPAGCAFQRAALDRARALHADADMHFARIGPELLAEMIWQGDGCDYDLLPPDYLNPIGWMETGRLLGPFAHTAAALMQTQARCLHVYTETWRLIGLDLGAEPTADGSFLATLNQRLREAPADLSVRDILKG
ncbi:hypothetical protein roselon_02133 [Roseibacterium elongatum DSM 19469]|uniref:Uncharacterized protein n=1 Tax=Roseicyclus elongatus DSM 19469 TaxID=1294273 RepID=W8RTI1_9RHOB|nr:glycosyltransferase [Roseibacterium elongatum]AHM04478.1 hypothetical protein roselon_02133 [Roseibacterium elongatum DSM 19469]